MLYTTQIDFAFCFYDSILQKVQVEIRKSVAVKTKV